MQTIKKRKVAPTAEQRLRREIATLLAIAPTELREWNTTVCPECRTPVTRAPLCAVQGITHLPPIYYVLAPESEYGDMPLGIGDSSVQALTDLLMSIKMGVMFDRIAHDL